MTDKHKKDLRKLLNKKDYESIVEILLTYSPQYDKLITMILEEPLMGIARLKLILKQTSKDLKTSVLTFSSWSEAERLNNLILKAKKKAKRKTKNFALMMFSDKKYCV